MDDFLKLLFLTMHYLKDHFLLEYPSDNQYRKDFSPMTSFEHHFSADQLPVEYQNYYCFENYWQGGKVYQNIDKKLSDQWWFKQNKGKRKLRISKKMLIDKNKNWKNDKYDGKVLHSVYSDINNGQEILGKNYSDNWILSRKKVYVPKYYQLLIKTKSFIELKEYVNKGKDVIIYDIDGPRKISDNKDSELDCIEINQLNLKNKINCDKFPFGHGYIVAAALADINLEKFIN